MITKNSNSAAQTIEIGKRIGIQLQKGDILAMQGTLAAGKTTMTKGIADALGVTETITSPTFCLISEYEGKIPLYHIDVYRLNGIDDFVDLGADDMLYGNGVTIIEWSEKIMDELPDSTIIIKIDTSKNKKTDRIITIENWPYGEI